MKKRGCETTLKITPAKLQFFCEHVPKLTPKWHPKCELISGKITRGCPGWPILISSRKKWSPCPLKVTPKNEKRCQKGSWIHIKVQKGGTKAVKHNIFPWHSGLSEAVAAARRTARSGVRTKARRTARSAYNKLNTGLNGHETEIFGGIICIHLLG